MSQRLFRIWIFWFLLVWILSFPWIGFTTEPQWHRVNWVPFASPADRFRDIIPNILWFVPFGYIVMRRHASLRRVVLVVLLAAAVSVSAEAMQVFSLERYPSATDVTAAILGALGGALPTLWLRRSSKPRTWTD